METLSALLETRLRSALLSEGLQAEPKVTPASDTRFGDYQTNIAMVMAKQLRRNPRELAQSIISKLDLEGVAEPPQMAGAGFINFRLLPSFVTARLLALASDSHFGVLKPAQPRKIVVDFSSPNVAKPMHVGHIRSTILGDALARTAEFLGHQVIRDNHIGDWGTQFGMILLGWKTELNPEALASDPLGEMERIYKLISSRKEDPQVMNAARNELVKLQSGDEENLGLWREMIRLSEGQFENIYRRLGVRFDVTLGESFYNPKLKEVVEDLQKSGLARESDGAICVFSDGTLPPEKDPFMIKDQEWQPAPALIQKKDGAANYTTTDLATLQHRVAEWNPDEIVYVTDGRQQMHFRQLFAIFKRWRPEDYARIRLAHVWFGTILDEHGRPFKTRSGDTVKLADLLDEAEERALKLVTEKNPSMPEEDRREIARVIGLGAVKYADLLPNRQTDYVFSWERMLSFQGNTAPYLQNAYVRIRAIFRKAAAEGIIPQQAEDIQGFRVSEPAEVELAKKLFQYGEVVPQILDDYRPNLLANYLYDLAGVFHGFFEACSVLRSEEPVRSSRFVLCEVTSRILRHGLELLGIEVPERM